MSLVSKPLPWVIAACACLAVSVVATVMPQPSMSATDTRPLCLRQARAQFGESGHKAALTSGIFRQWRELSCRGVNLGPATSAVFHSGKPGAETQTFLGTGQRITWDRKTGRTWVGVIKTVAGDIFSSHGIKPQPSLPITPAWITQFHSGKNWGAAVEPIYKPQWSARTLRQEFVRGTGSFDGHHVTWQANASKTPWVVNAHEWRPIGIAVGQFGRNLKHQNIPMATAGLSTKLADKASRTCVQRLVGFAGWPSHLDYTIETWNHRHALVHAKFTTSQGKVGDHMVLRRVSGEWVIWAVLRSNNAPVTCPPWTPPANGYPNTFAVGDSVMVDGQPYLQQMGITVDAAVSRQFDTGVEILREHQADGTLPARVVIGLGTNGPMSQSDFDNTLRMLKGETRVVVLTVREPRWWQNQVNAVVRSGVAKFKNARLADWFAASDGHPEWFAGDGIHLDSTGALAYAHVIANALGGP